MDMLKECKENSHLFAWPGGVGEQNRIPPDHSCQCGKTRFGDTPPLLTERSDISAEVVHNASCAICRNEDCPMLVRLETVRFGVTTEVRESLGQVQTVRVWRDYIFETAYCSNCLSDDLWTDLLHTLGLAAGA